jgi:peptide/nickel transport system substrate-binding protein
LAKKLASAGRPADAGERALLAAFPGAVREDILEGRWEPPVDDGSGRDRTMAQRALALLGEAGYTIRDGVLVDP